MTLPFHIVEMLKQKSGNELRLPSDCEFLSLDIESKTGVRIIAALMLLTAGDRAKEAQRPNSELGTVFIGMGLDEVDVFA